MTSKITLSINQPDSNNPQGMLPRRPLKSHDLHALNIAIGLKGKTCQKNHF